MRSYIGALDVSGFRTICIRAQTEVERPSDRASVPDRSSDPSRRETKFYRLCGLDPPPVLDVQHIPPRYRYVRGTLIQRLLRICTHACIYLV